MRFEGRKVLVVDDLPAQTRSLCEALRGSGCAVIEAQDLTSAREHLARESFDLIILDRDIHVEGGREDGLDLCRHIRGLGIPARVIFYTNLVSPTEHRDGWNAGADDYMEKTWSIEVAFARCEAHLMRMPEPASAGSVKRYAHPSLQEGQHLIVDEVARTVVRARDADLVRRGMINPRQLPTADRDIYRTIKMTDMDLAVFFYLYEQPDQWIGELQLLKHVWAYSDLRIQKMLTDPDANSGLVQTTVARIRRKIDTRLDATGGAKQGFDNRRPWAFIETSSAEQQTFVSYRFNAAHRRAVDTARS